MRAFTIVLAVILIFLPKNSPAAESLEETARAAIVAFTEAVIEGPEAVDKLLAPEYQIMRANGVGYDRKGYIEQGAPSVQAKPVFHHKDIVATADDLVMVVRYILEIDETIDGSPVARSAPRLTVFREIEGQWKVVAHANFAATEPRD